MLKLVRTEKEIDDVLNTAANWEAAGGSPFPAIGYAEGVAAGIRWVMGDEEDHPFAGADEPPNLYEEDD